MPVVCRVTCPAWPNISESDGHVARAIAARRIAVSTVAWNQAEARFDGFEEGFEYNEGRADPAGPRGRGADDDARYPRDPAPR